MGAPVVHWEINSNNAEKLHEFYARLFDWKINAENPMRYGLVSTGSPTGIGGGIGQNDPNQPSPTAVTFYVAVPELQGILNKAVNLGGTIVMPPTEIPNMVTFALFRDLDGNTIGIIKDEMPKPTPKKRAKKKKSPTKKAIKAKARKR